MPVYRQCLGKQEHKTESSMIIQLTFAIMTSLGEGVCRDVVAKQEL